jgi:hypothetical protein
MKIVAQKLAFSLRFLYIAEKLKRYDYGIDDFILGVRGVNGIARI